MPRLFRLTLAAALLCTGATSCDKGKTAAQIHLEQEKAWQADKRQRAIKYYRDLAQKYPESPYAAQAKERLAAMGATAEAAPGAPGAPAKP